MLKNKVTYILISLLLVGCSIVKAQGEISTSENKPAISILDAIEIAKTFESKQVRQNKRAGEAPEPYFVHVQLMSYGEALSRSSHEKQPNTSKVASKVWVIGMVGSWEEDNATSSQKPKPSFEYLELIINSSTGKIEGFSTYINIDMVDEFTAEKFQSNKTYSLNECEGEKPKIIRYRVQENDSIFTLSSRFGIDPETILWANENKLHDNPNNIKPEMELIILPIDGLYYRWKAKDTLESVSERFSASPESILNWQGICPEELKSYMDFSFKPGTHVIIPNGTRLINND